MTAAPAARSEGGYVLQTTVGNETTTKQTVRCKYLVIATGERRHTDFLDCLLCAFLRVFCVPFDHHDCAMPHPD